MITGRDLGIPLASLPHILGHENAGIVKAIGDEVQGFEVGDKVLCYPFQSNGGSLAERYGLIHKQIRELPLELTPAEAFV